MKVLYCKVLTIEEKTYRQRVNETEYKLVVENKMFLSYPSLKELAELRLKNMLTMGS